MSKATHHAEITLKPDGKGSCHIDGHDLSDIIVAGGIEISSDSIGLPRLILHIAPVALAVKGDFNIQVPPETQEALITLGWTPPK